MAVFPNSKKEEVRSTNGSAAGGPMAINTLVKGTTVEGNVSSESDIRVDGSIKGNLMCRARVVIGSTGTIEGEIRCVNAVIEGSFNGKLWVEDTLNIRETATVNAEVQTNKLVVQAGATFNGSVKMGEVSATAVRSTKPATAAPGNQASGQR